MGARACAYSRDDLLAAGLSPKEIPKYQRIAGRYRIRGIPEPAPGPWVARYRQKLAAGWTWKSKRPSDVDPDTWVRYQNFASSHRTDGSPIPDVYAYIKSHMGDVGGGVYRRTVSPKRVKVREVRCHADVKAIAERCRQIVAAKLREQGMCLPLLKPPGGR